MLRYNSNIMNDSSTPPRILIIKLWAIGDIVMATPIVHSLRKRFPGCHITWMADARYASILENAEEIDELIPFDASAWIKKFRKLHWISFIAATIKLRRELKKRKFDITLNFVCDKWWATLLNTSPKCYALYYKPNAPYSRFYTDSIIKATPMQATLFTLHMGDLLGCEPSNTAMFVGKLPHETEFLEHFFSERNIATDHPLVVISPFSSDIKRNWPIENYAKIVDYIAEHHDASVLISHAPYDLDKANALLELCAHKPALTGNTTLLEYVAILRAADLVVSNDSSALHIASAAGSPILGLFGPVPPAHRMPLSGISRAIASSPDGASGSIENITIAQVTDAVDSLMTERTAAFDRASTRRY